MNMPYVWSTTRKPGAYVDLSTYLLENRTIFIGPEITNELASVICMQMLALAQEDAPISLYLNCYGGSVPAGLAIMDMVNSINREMPVHTYCLGECVGVAVTILVSGRKEARYAFPSARISLYQEWYGVESIWGAASQDSNERDRLMKTVQAALEEKTSLKEEPAALASALKDLRFFDAQEAIGLGIVDHLCGVGETPATVGYGPRSSHEVLP